MTPSGTHFTSGRPRFRSAELVSIQARSGDAGAWRGALSAHTPIDAVNRVDGDFAVALGDAGGQDGWLAVDRFAIQTLCYTVREGRLHAAARADEVAGPDAEIDPQAIFDYLFFHCIPSPRTIFKGVNRLPPGHIATFQGGTVRAEPYWIPTFSEPKGEPDFQSLKDEFLRLVRDAVQRELDGSIPACFLSGGTDSSTVAGMIGRALGQPAHTYSIGFEAEGYDEMAFARIAASHFGTIHHEYYVTPEDLVANIPRVAAHYDQPFGNSSSLPAFLCTAKARRDGVSRLLAGDGGDELFGGNSRYAKQRVFDWYGHLPKAVRNGVLEPLLERTAMGTLPLLKKGRSYVEQAKVPMPDRLQMYNLLLRLRPDEILTPEFLNRVDQQGPLSLQREVWEMSRANNDLNRTLAFDWRFTLAESDLPKVCGAAQLAGVTVGFPLLDTALTDFSCQLPSHFKLKGLKLRWFFKEALRGFLPDEIINKRKHGFGLPFGVWANRHAELKELAADSLAGLASRGIVRKEFVRQLMQVHLPAHPGYFGEMVWILMMLEQWLRMHPNVRLKI